MIAPPCDDRRTTHLETECLANSDPALIVTSSGGRSSSPTSTPCASRSTSTRSDPEIAALPMALKLDDAEPRAPDRQGHRLARGERGSRHAAPSRPRTSCATLMNMATDGGDGRPRVRGPPRPPGVQGLPVHDRLARRQAASSPRASRSSIVGSGFSGLAMGVQLERLGIPYVLLERQPEPGGTWSINRYPDIRVDTISITYEFSFEKDYRWTRVLRPGRRGARVPRHTSRRSTASTRTPGSATTLKQATFDEDRDVWVLEVDTPDGIETIEANVVVNARRHVHQPEVPELRGPGALRGPDRAPGPLARRLRRHGQARRRRRQRLDRRAAARARSPSRRRAGLRVPAHAAVDQPPRQVRQAGRARGPLAARQLPRLLELVALHGHRRAVPAPTASSSPTRSGRPRAASSTR